MRRYLFVLGSVALSANLALRALAADDIVPNKLNTYGSDLREPVKAPDAKKPAILLDDTAPDSKVAAPAQVESKTDTKTAPKADTKADAKPEQKTEAKTESKSRVTFVDTNDVSEDAGISFKEFLENFQGDEELRSDKQINSALEEAYKYRRKLNKPANRAELKEAEENVKRIQSKYKIAQSAHTTLNGVHIEALRSALDKLDANTPVVLVEDKKGPVKLVAKLVKGDDKKSHVSLAYVPNAAWTGKEGGPLDEDDLSDLNAALKDMHFAVDTNDKGELSEGWKAKAISRINDKFPAYKRAASDEVTRMAGDIGSKEAYSELSSAKRALDEMKSDSGRRNKILETEAKIDLLKWAKEGGHKIDDMSYCDVVKNSVKDWAKFSKQMKSDCDELNPKKIKEQQKIAKDAAAKDTEKSGRDELQKVKDAAEAAISGMRRDYETLANCVAAAKNRNAAASASTLVNPMDAYMKFGACSGTNSSMFPIMASEIGERLQCEEAGAKEEQNCYRNIQNANIPACSAFAACSKDVQAFAEQCQQNADQAACQQELATRSQACGRADTDCRAAQQDMSQKCEGAGNPTVDACLSAQGTNADEDMDMKSRKIVAKNLSKKSGAEGAEEIANERRALQAVVACTLKSMDQGKYFLHTAEPKNPEDAKKIQDAVVAVRMMQERNVAARKLLDAISVVEARRTTDTQGQFRSLNNGAGGVNVSGGGGGSGSATVPNLAPSRGLNNGPSDRGNLPAGAINGTGAVGTGATGNGYMAPAVMPQQQGQGNGAVLPPQGGAAQPAGQPVHVPNF